MDNLRENLSQEELEAGNAAILRLLSVAKWAVNTIEQFYTIPDSIAGVEEQEQHRNSARQDEEMAAATRASIETSHNEFLAKEREDARRSAIDDLEAQHDKAIAEGKEAKEKLMARKRAVERKPPVPKRAKGTVEPCAICLQRLGKRSGCAVFPGCAHSQFHSDCANKSYQATGKCPICNIDRGVPFTLR